MYIWCDKSLQNPFEWHWMTIFYHQIMTNKYDLWNGLMSILQYGYIWLYHHGIFGDICSGHIHKQILIGTSPPWTFFEEETWHCLAKNLKSVKHYTERILRNLQIWGCHHKRSLVYIYIYNTIEHAWTDKTGDIYIYHGIWFFINNRICCQPDAALGIQLGVTLEAIHSISAHCWLAQKGDATWISNDANKTWHTHTQSHTISHIHQDFAMPLQNLDMERKGIWR